MRLHNWHPCVLWRWRPLSRQQHTLLGERAGQARQLHERLRLRTKATAFVHSPASQHALVLLSAQMTVSRAYLTSPGQLYAVLLYPSSFPPSMSVRAPAMYFLKREPCAVQHSKKQLIFSAPGGGRS